MEKSEVREIRVCKGLQEGDEEGVGGKKGTNVNKS